MKYELALRLKEAGFPQHLGLEAIAVDYDMPPYEATLEEIIEACGDRFECLYRICGDTVHETKEWHAHAFGTVSGVGSTSLEAGANLYIVLHEKRS